MNAQIEQAANTLFCNHTSQNGTDAFWPIGNEDNGIEVCIICGAVRNTNYPEETNIDLAEVKGRI